LAGSKEIKIILNDPTEQSCLEPMQGRKGTGRQSSRSRAIAAAVAIAIVSVEKVGEKAVLNVHFPDFCERMISNDSIAIEADIFIHINVE
jgi:hypothetical protein